MGSYIYCNDHKIKNINFAITPEEQENGLMFEARPKILVFLYKFPKIRKFWMKNCYLPLDIVFVKNNKIISIEKGIPENEDLIGPDKESDYVIEFPYGFCKNNDMFLDSDINLKLELDILKKLLTLTTV